MIDVGDKIPEFSLLDDQDNVVTNHDFDGRKYVLYFYPKDLTPGCTNEAVCFDEMLDGFRAEGYEIYGINKDTPELHRQFKEKYHLRFTLLSDIEGTFIEKMGMWQEKKNFGKTYYGVARSTFVVNEDGVVERVYHKVKPVEHAQDVLRDIT
ncbi:MAG TPA: thioredoxin-dependent thiol peroxidase [Clostridiaceae bacterium]|jgi:peroxiredoxin Q/BCP|nr:thioredoxin-dependent thiol peroxidase [Clostridiaceae bacterium]